MRHVIVPDLTVAPPPPALGAVVHTLDGQTMGTTWCVKLAAGIHANPPELETTTLHAAITRELDDIVAQMSTWEPDSLISRYNRAAPDTWHDLPAAFVTVLACALEVARASDGACDPASGRLVSLWGFGPGGNINPNGHTNTHPDTQLRYDQPGFAPPSPAAIDHARAASGWQRVTLDAERSRVHQPGGVWLDFSGIAKGYAVDRLAHCLAARGSESFLVEVGGELRGAGVRPDGQPWWVALETPTPDPAENTPADEYLVALYQLAMATSGDYRRYFVHHGQRYPHTIDPRSGAPIANGLASVSVVHPECMLADAWSTALGVLGPESGLACADAHGLTALFLTRTDSGLRASHSRALAALLQ